VGETPREDPRRVVEEEIPGQQQQEAGNDGAVESEGPTLAQLCLPSGRVRGTLAPQEHTRLRTAHSIFRRRPQAGQPM